MNDTKLRFDCKKVPVAFLHAEKMAEVASLNIIRIGFPASLLTRKWANERVLGKPYKFY